MSQNEFSLSLVVPVYNEAEVVDSFFARVVPILEKLTPYYEIICVNDGSEDDTLAMISAARGSNPAIKYLDLSRRYGKEQALTAGLDRADSDIVIPIDVDLQDPPELIPQMIEKWQEGYDMVLARRASRGGDSLTKKLSAGLFYRLMSKMGDVRLPENVGDFRLLDRRVVAALREFPERTRFMKGLFALLGFKQTTLEYDRPERVGGNSKWNYWKLWNFGIEGVLSFTTMPLRVWSYLGGVVAILSLIYMSYIVFRTLYWGVDVPGYASLLVVILFFSGMNMMGIGVIGEYLARVFVEVKQRPLYLVRESAGFAERDSQVPPRASSGNNRT